MATQEEFQVSGIVLKTHPFAESDLIVRVLTPSHGKISCFAKSARSSKRRFAHSLDILDRGTFTLSVGRGELLPIRAFEPHHQLKSIRTNLDHIAAASLLCEVFEALINEGTDPQAYTELYELLDLTLSSIDEAKERTETLRVTYVSIAFLAERMGVFSRSDTTASGRALSQVLDVIEHFLGKQLAARSSVEDIVARLKRERAAGE